ncbi:MAG: hypothetical protein J4F47_01505 [Alphaproteobacteria bacterium]|nr:hypothetical protein [Alphaproteobacteria bacterium]
MIASFERFARFLVPATACLVLTLPVAAAAQAPESDVTVPAENPSGAPAAETSGATDGSPIQLLPDRIADPAATDADAGEEEDVPPAFRVPELAEGVMVSDLPSARPGWIGALTGSEGGLGWTMWEGTDAALAERLLAAVPAAMESPAMRSLTRRLLLSRAAAPERPPQREIVQLGPDGQPVDTDTGEVAHFLEERVHLLVQLADGEGLALLADVVAPDTVGAALDERVLEGLLLAGDTDLACPEVRRRLASRPTARLRMALTICLIRRGALDAAYLTLELLEDELPANPPLTALAFAVLDDTPLPEGMSLPDDDYLALALLASGGESLVRQQNSAGLPVLRAIAEGASGDTVRRIYAAEQTARVGALRDGALVETYAAVEFTPDQLRSAGTEADTLHPVLARALLFQAALKATTAIDRARFLRLLWDRAGPEPGFTVMAKVTAPVAATVKPRQDLAWFSVAAARALLAGGRYAEAEAWVAMLAGSADLDFMTSGQLYSLFPALALAGRPVPEPFEVFPREDVRATLPVTGPPADHADQLSRLLVVLEAMDVPVPRGSWMTLLDDAAVRTTATIPSAPARYQLRDAVAETRTAETVLFVLAILGSGGPAGADPLTLNAAIRSLRAIGLMEDARAIALEAII